MLPPAPFRGQVPSAESSSGYPYLGSLLTVSLTICLLTDRSAGVLVFSIAQNLSCQFCPVSSRGSQLRLRAPTGTNNWVSPLLPDPGSSLERWMVTLVLSQSVEPCWNRLASSNKTDRTALW